MSIIHLIILFPLIGFLFLIALKTKISKNLSILIAIFTIGVSFLLTLCLDLFFFLSHSAFLELKCWTWINCVNFKIDFNLLFDPLSLTMITMVTTIGLLIHVFSYWYMRLDEEIVLFFSFMNLFIASMLLLILADNLILMYLGWEGVGVCSYLLIGFYYIDKKNGIAARKAFIMTKIGDICLMVSIFLIYFVFHSVNFEQLDFLSNYHIVIVNESILKWITTLLVIGAISKSAQVPLQTWLVDAMVGPTPVSALIHAATMVTAGVYLIVRMLHLFVLVPQILVLVGAIGVVTLFIASISALVQENIKRILAYSTMSQIGYMFMALSVQAWSASIIHLITHAVFKALLFLSAASIIKSCNYEQNIFKMKRLSREHNLVYLAFLIGGLSLVSFPIVSLGFYSKEEILVRILDSGHMVFFSVALLGVFFTSLYTFRVIFTIFNNRKGTIQSSLVYNIFHNVPLGILSILSTSIGLLCIPNLI
ncbi:NADH-quinone oxidoreductase subunit L, partial [Buchnera aphidicola (Hormaphis cornu)]